MIQADAEVRTKCLCGIYVIIDNGEKDFFNHKCVCAWSHTFSMGEEMWQLNIVHSQQGFDRGV